MAAEQIAVLVMAYGGPGNIDEVEPYLMDVRGGRPTKPQLVDEIRARYARIGGRSPILEFTRAQAAGIGRALGDPFSVYVGMRHWHPYIPDVVDELTRAGHRRVVGVAMVPHYSNMSVGAYEKKLLQAAASPAIPAPTTTTLTATLALRRQCARRRLPRPPGRRRR